MASIGAITFPIMSGAIVQPSRTVQPIERIGVDGLAFRDMGYREQTSVLKTTTTAANAAAAAAAASSYTLLRGQVVTVVDAHGNTHNNVLITNVSSRYQPVLKQSINSDNYIVAARWSVTKLYEAGA